MFAKLVGNDRNKVILRRLVQNERFGATLIFAGPDGVGKRQFALAFAKLANCHDPLEGLTDSCDRCPSCFRIDLGAHPDVRLLEPDEKGTIKVDPVRAFAAKIRFRPYEGRQRFFLIDNSDKLREQAANALLKTLEEPPPTSNVILLTSRPDALLPTVRSRSQQLAFAALPTEDMERYIVSQQGRPKAEAALLARLSEGSIGQLSAIDLSDYRKERRELIELAELLASEGKRYRLVKAAEYIGKQERDVFEKKLDLLMRILRDMVLLVSGRDQNQIVNIDEAEKLEVLATKIGWRRLTAWIEGFNELRLNLVVNINRQIALDGLLQRLASTV